MCPLKFIAFVGKIWCSLLLRRASTPTIASVASTFQQVVLDNSW